MSAPPTDDLVVESLKKNYFALALTENFPRTPGVTEKLDNLEEAIRELTKPAVARPPLQPKDT